MDRARRALDGHGLALDCCFDHELPGERERGCYTRCALRQQPKCRAGTNTHSHVFNSLCPLISGCDDALHSMYGNRCSDSARDKFMAVDAAEHWFAIGNLHRRRCRCVSSGAGDWVVIMLNQLMNEIRAGGTLEVGALATRLNTTPQLIEAMLEHLQRSGWIAAYVGCSDGCLGCGLQDACRKTPGTIRLWQSRGED